VLAIWATQSFGELLRGGDRLHLPLINESGSRPAQVPRRKRILVQNFCGGILPRICPEFLPQAPAALATDALEADALEVRRPRGAGEAGAIGSSPPS
jgi:hypothetical protein